MYDDAGRLGKVGSQVDPRYAPPGGCGQERVAGIEERFTQRTERRTSTADRRATDKWDTTITAAGLIC